MVIAVVMLILSTFVISSAATASTPQVSYSIFPSWVTPPNPQGHGTVGLTVVYATPANSEVLALKLTVLLPPNVTNSTGGHSVTALFTVQMPINYEFNVTVRGNVTGPLTFKALLTFYVYYDNKTVTETSQTEFTLPYYGTVGGEVVSRSSFVHFGFNWIPISVVNNGTAELLDVTLEADGKNVSVAELAPHSSFNTTLTIYVPPTNALNISLPVKLTYWTPYGTWVTVHETLRFVVLENYSVVAVTYYNFLSPNPHYLDLGENYIRFNLTNYLGLTVNSSWLLVLQNNSVIRAYFVQDWKPLQNLTLYLTVNASSPYDIGFELYKNGKLYNLTSLRIPMIDSPRLALNLTVERGEELLEITNMLTVNVTDVTVMGAGVNVTYGVIEPGETVLVKLNLTSSEHIYIKYRVMNVTVTEERTIQLGSSNLVVYYYPFKTTDPHVLYLTVGVINEGKSPIYNAYLLLNLNDTSAQVSPYVIHIGSLQPDQAFYQAVSLYMGSPLPKVVVIPAQIVYNDGPDLVVTNYTFVINVYSIYNYNHNPAVLLLEYLSYSIYGVPVLFIVAIIILIIVLIIPRRRRK